MGNQIKRIAVITGTLRLGGTTTFLLNLGGELKKRGIDFRIFSFSSENPMASDFEKLLIPVECQRDNTLIFEDRLLKALNDLSCFHPDTLIANIGPESFEVMRYCGGSRKIGMIQTDEPGIYGVVSKYASSLDLIGAVSRRISETVLADPLLGNIPVGYLPYGIRIPEKCLPRIPESGMLEILYLGRLESEQKRAYLFPQIVKELKKRKVAFRLTLCGEGSFEKTLREQLAQEIHEGPVRIIPTIGYGEIDRFLDDYHVFLLPSDYEGLPLSLLESMAHGLIPVVSDLPSGIREVVNPDNGVLVPTNDTAGYAVSIASLSADRSLMKKMSLAARMSVQNHFSNEAMADRWIECLEMMPETPFHVTSCEIKHPLTIPVRSWRNLKALRHLRRIVKAWLGS
jgi:glycosyltransferase involved in cell wall biosynthesis